MILTTVAEIMTNRIPARSRRQAMDWSLVLASQGIEPVIDMSEESGWGLAVPEQDYDRALNILEQYRLENRRWPWRQKISPRGVLFDWASLGWVALVAIFYWLQTHAAHDITRAGMMDAIAVSDGEWWRLFTAIWLHADLGHFSTNASIGFFLLALTMGNFGTGVGLLSAYLAGAGGNIADWVLFSQGHRSLGASGMVMGCVGLLTSQALFTNGRRSDRLKFGLGGLAAGAMLFALFGLDPNADVIAHLGGFVTGLALGIVLLPVRRGTQKSVVNLFAGATFCILVVWPWWLVFSKAAIF